MRFQSVYSSPNEPRPKRRDSLKNFRYQNPPRHSCTASKDFPFSVVEEYLALGLLLHVTVPWAHCHQCCLMHSSWDPKIGQACKYRTIHGLQTFSSPQKEDLFCSTQLVFSHLGILETTEGLQQHLYHFACCKRIVKRCYKTLFTTQLAPLCCVLIYMSLLRWESRYIHPDFSCNKTTSVSCTVMCRLTVSWTSKGF